MDYQFLDVRRDGPVEHLMLNRPEVRNAFNDVLVAELRHWTQAVTADAAVRVVVLGGRGPAFCAGADVEWMARTASQTQEENLRDATAAADLFASLNAMPKAVIGRVHGAALGGGAGLAAVCDIVVAGESASFGFPEVRLGILPAVVAPYVHAKIGTSLARELFLTGQRVPAQRARDIRLVHIVVPDADLDAHVDACVRELLGAAPTAIAAAKALLARLPSLELGETPSVTAGALAAQRAAPEGQEGLRAFLDKRLPNWHVPPHPDR